MAPSLQDLIDHLLAEIALCGDQGASPADILTFIDTFYSSAVHETTARSHTVDRPFQEKVWSWLTRHPEVTVGRDRGSNHLHLNDAERLAREADPEHAVRVFVSRERRWLAVAGHEPDETKVLPLEFALLSIIASHKSNGIFQTDLVKLSGQDKRSVPKRTDVLQEKGYIEKRAIQIKSVRTSLCVLRRFSKSDHSGAGTAGDREERLIDFKDFNDKLFAILREHKIIARTDLKSALGFADPWRWRVLSRALRKFERIGVLKRVRATSQYADDMKKLHPCVMLVREPTERDYELFHEYSQNIYTDLEQEDGLELEDGAGSADASEDFTSAGANKAVGMVKQEENVEEAGRTIPAWSPDRNIHNQIFDLVDQAGTSGITNLDLLRASFGSFFRRPLENTLARLVECWQLSQPLHLRHLAIVRDTALEKTITHYIHYSTANFQKLVDAGEASWEAVEFVRRNTKAEKISVPPVDAVPELDENGLPKAVPTKELIKNGNASLLAGVLVVNPADYHCTGNDPMPFRLKDGSYVIRFGAPGMNRVGRPKGTPNKVKLKQEHLSELGADVIPEQDPVAIRRLKKAQRDEERFRGMSEKEKLEALGLDETWTEYSVLLLERTEPGVYITPRGRRRPAGKRQGRPRISRLAVFRSPKLASLPWFSETQEGEPEDEAASTMQEVSRAQSVETTPVPSFIAINTPATTSLVPDTPSRGTKRTLRSRIPLDAEAEPNHERPAKQQRISDTQGSQDVTEVHVIRSEEPLSDGQKTGEPSTEAVKKAPSRTNKRRREPSPIPTGEDVAAHKSMQGLASEIAKAPSPAEQKQAGLSQARQNLETPSKKRRYEPQGLQGEHTASTLSPAATTKNVTEQVALSKPTKVENGGHRPVDAEAIGTPLEDAAHEDIVVDETAPAATAETGTTINNVQEANAIDLKLTDGTPDVEQRDVSQTPEGHRQRTKRQDKLGSVAVLRRSIIMDIIEKAGGAYSMGTEIWYPFATAWKKTKYKEKPDMRTVKTSIKHLIDAGKLRQFTFSGRDSKGVMVTKSIVAKPELQPDDPIIKDLQHKMLTTTARYYFPPGVEVDPELTKSSAKSAKSTASGEPKMAKLPIERGITVHLHQKPAFVLALEKRKGQSIQRRLLQRLQSDTEIRRPSGVVRLAKLQRRPARDSLERDLTPVSRTREKGQQRKRILKHRTPVDGLTGEDGEGGAPRAPRRLKRLWMPISLMAPYAMFMNPVQTFHSGTGTFSTEAGLVAVRAAAVARARAAFRFPKSLDDLLEQVKRSPVDFSRAVDPRTSKFFCETGVILRWELQNEEFILEKTAEEGQKFSFIQQTLDDFPEAVPIEGDIQIEIDQSAYPRVRVPKVRKIREAARRLELLEPEKSPPEEAEEAEESEEPSESEVSSDSEDSDDSLDALDLLFSADSRRRRNDYVPQNRRLEKLAAESPRDVVVAKPPNRPAARRNRALQHLPRLIAERILTAIVVVRALAGGYEGKIVDWQLVCQSFPNQDPKMIQERGKNILSRNRLQVAKMQSDFQERFIVAYANGQVPPINYDDLEGYDWERVVDWAQAELDIPKSEKLPDLPATKDQFDSVFELREEPPVTLDELYQNTHGVTVNRRRALYAGVPFAIPLPDKPAQPTARQAELARLEVAKTWVRANIVAPEESYRPAEARQALANFGGRLVDDALQTLTTERVVSQGNRGRITPGRNYDITEFFLHMLGRRRNIEVTQLRRAARFKTGTLDPALQSTGSFTINYHAEDGDILALINLAAERRIILKPKDPPRDKFGLTDGGYLTRQIDKDKLRFVVQVQPVEASYTYGNPIREKVANTPPPCPPRAAITEGEFVPEKIPLWFDIHGNFVRVLWEFAVAAVVGIVAVRPGISAKGVASMVQPSMGAWEVLLLLRWMADVGVLRRENEYGEAVEETTGWQVQEWWWMVLA
ncbi:transcription factor tau subunit sfc3 [Aspergillus udagawae]|nr:transcription factor tau subunit sfc3 [Aspergillus udagawae]